MILATLILGATIANLNMSVANVALPTIDRDLDATQPKLDLVAVGFTLGLAASVLYLGALADRHGRRRMLLFGLLLSIQIQDSFGGAADVAKTLPDADAQKLMHAAEQAFTQGSHLAVAVALVIAVSGLVLVLVAFPRKEKENELEAGYAAEDPAGPAPGA